nr:hypothetical protein CFP56_71528 [Quercus suber]
MALGEIGNGWRFLFGVCGWWSSWGLAFTMKVGSEGYILELIGQSLILLMMDYRMSGTLKCCATTFSLDFLYESCGMYILKILEPILQLMERTFNAMQITFNSFWLKSNLLG